jgi:hypothetical protein
MTEITTSQVKKTVSSPLGKKATRLQTGGRWLVVRTNSCHTSGFRKLQIYSTRRINLIDAFVSTRRLIRKDWNRYRCDTRPLDAHNVSTQV